MSISSSYNATLAVTTRTKVLDVDLPTTLQLLLVTLSTTGGDGDWQIYIDKNLADLAEPAQPALVTATAGGTIPRNTKVYVRVTPIDANGLEGAPSDGNKSITVGATTDTNKVTVTITAVTGASSFNVYAGTRPGSETFIANTVSTTFVITMLPVDTIGGVPTQADIIVHGKRGGTEPFNFYGVNASLRLIIYVSLSAQPGEAAISVIMA